MQTVASQFRQYWTPILKPYADKAGINIDHLVTQLGHESMWGTITPRGSNNYAGIHEFRKGRDGVMARDAGNLRKFRKYDSDDAFAQDYVGLVSRLYPGTKGAQDFNAFATALQNGKGGRKWAESPTYVKDLNTVYNKSIAPLTNQPTNQPTNPSKPAVDSVYKGGNPVSDVYAFTGKVEVPTVTNHYTKLYTQQTKPADTPSFPVYTSEFSDGYVEGGKDFYKLWGIR